MSSELADSFNVHRGHPPFACFRAIQIAVRTSDITLDDGLVSTNGAFSVLIYQYSGQLSMQ